MIFDNMTTYTTESVLQGHPDKICDQISDLEDYFDRMYQLFLDIGTKKIDNVSMDLLSMGMSGDYLTAIRHGSNMVRLGTAIFGKRNY